MAFFSKRGGAAVFAITGVLVMTGGAAQANSVTDWNEIAVSYIASGPGLSNPARGPAGFLDLTLVQLAVHDAVQAIEHRYPPYYYTGQGSGKVDAAVAAAAHGVLVSLRPASAGEISAKYQTYLTTNGLNGDPGLAVGAAAATALLTQKRAQPTPAPFLGGDGPGEWRNIVNGVKQPMGFVFLAYTAPYTLEEPAQFRPEPPPPMSSMRYVRAYNEVKALGAATGSTRTAAQTDVANFWNGDPMLRWNSGMREIFTDKDVGDSARALALANLSTADALIAAFEAKIFYNFWRPITAIRNDDGNPKTAPDPNWTTFIPTPPYPDYPSGANSVAGAMAQSLRLVLGTDNVSFHMRAPLALNQPPTVRSYSSLSAAEAEVVEARILEGIHFRDAEEDAIQLGHRVARWAYQQAFRGNQGVSEGVPVEFEVEDVK